MMSEDIEKLLVDELKIVNKHLPHQKINLCTALKLEKPEIILRDGSIHRFDRKELNLIREILGEKACNIDVPIIIYYHYSFGKNIYEVNGKVEIELINKLLEKQTIINDKLYLSRPEIIHIRMVLRTTTTIAFIP